MSILRQIWEVYKKYFFIHFNNTFFRIWRLGPFFSDAAVTFQFKIFVNLTVWSGPKLTLKNVFYFIV
jgi:hypothetical protein